MTQPAPRRSRERWAGLTGGLVLIGVGIVFLFAELGLLSMRHLWRWTPLVLVVLGIGKLATATSFPRVKGGLVLLLLGGWGLINTHDVWLFYWGNSWPLLLVGFGLIAVLEAVVTATRRHDIETGSAPASGDLDAGPPPVPPTPGSGLEIGSASGGEGHGR